MERRHFLKIAVGAAAGAAVLAAGAEAAPLSPQPLAGDQRLPSAPAEPAVVTGDEVDHLKPEQVRWGWHRHWHRRHWGWHRRHWRRHWGWHRRHWHRRHWHRWHHRHW